MSIVELMLKVKTGYGGELSILLSAFFPLLNSLCTLIFIRKVKAVFQRGTDGPWQFGFGYYIARNDKADSENL
jgi:hypothetical protein